MEFHLKLLFIALPEVERQHEETAVFLVSAASLRKFVKNKTLFVYYLR